MKILITGHKGMIGNRLFNYFKNKNYNVKGIDIVDGSGDIRNYKSSEFFDIIIHCAALTSVTESIKKPNEYYKTNVLGTENLLLNCSYNKIIFMSTSAIYGEGLNHKESDTFKAISPYAKNKIEGENLIKEFSPNFLILRLANIYGAKKGERNVYQVFEEEPILPIYGDGKSLRDYLHVDILCKIIERGLNKNGIFNIGSGKTKTVLDIANEFNKPVKFLPERTGEIKEISMDLTKARNAKLGADL